MASKKHCLLVVIFYSILLPTVLAQEKEKEDSTKSLIDAVRENRVSREILKSVTRKPQQEQILNLRSEEAFLPYRGKMIRRIVVNRIGFDKNINDTTRSMKNTMVKVANALHKDTREGIIRDHIFFHEKRELNPYTLADNERFLRELDFIKDAQIFVVPLASTDDSVDVLVMTRDVFSVGGRVSPRSGNDVSFRIYDVNVLGMGQRVQFNGRYDYDRDPKFGYELYYRKSSVAGSLINLTAAYTQINSGSSYGTEEENAIYLRLDRPLVSPYSRMAGGVEVSRNWSENFYNTPDSLFRDYRYNITDVWLGYNIGIKNVSTDRSRRFISARVFEQHFNRKPQNSFDQLNPIFNSRVNVIGSFTMFKQEFYKTQYIYGFGITEDLPYGHTMSVLAGWQNLLGLKRPYFGFDAEKSFVHNAGNFYTFALRTGAFHDDDRLEDATILVSGNLFTKLKYFRRFMVRRTVEAGFAYVFNQKTNTLLDINGTFGLEGFRADSLLGTKRLYANYEMIVFTPWKLLGFHIAPIAFIDVAMLAPQNKTIFYDKPYFGVGTGVRTRNENLVFGTIEVKCFYYPRTVDTMSSFKVTVSSNLRIRYSGSFVRPPSFIVYN